MDVTITDREFALFQRLIHDKAGIHLSDAKKVLLVGRLSKRLKHHRLGAFDDYYRLLMGESGRDEMQTFVDLLTTNETYFFREPRHFEYVRSAILPAHRTRAPFRAWSGACSSGEEAYTLAMLLAEHLPHAEWEVFGTDISTAVLQKAQAGLYPVERCQGIPPEYLRKYCLKGVRSMAGKILVNPRLREKVRFAHLNLTAPIAAVGDFDLIFLRNVMIYFDNPTKRRVVENMLPYLKPGGHFIVGHSESLNGVTERLEPLFPTIYRKPR